MPNANLPISLSGRRCHELGRIIDGLPWWSPSGSGPKCSLPEK